MSNNNDIKMLVKKNNKPYEITIPFNHNLVPFYIPNEKLYRIDTISNIFFDIDDIVPIGYVIDDEEILLINGKNEKIVNQKIYYFDK